MSEGAGSSAVIALSLSPPQDIERLGYLQREFDNLTFELALQIIRNGCRVLYGGHLQSGGMTLQIFEHIGQAYRSDTSMPAISEKPVVSLIAGSELRKIQLTDLIDALLQFQHFMELHVIIDAKEHWWRAYAVDDEIQPTLHLVRPGEQSITIKSEHELSEYVKQHVITTDVESLSAMRQASIQIESARIVAGGRRGDMGISASGNVTRPPDQFNGKMPGIYEEIISSLPTSPVIILAAWGGAAREAAFDLDLLNVDDLRTSYIGKEQDGLREARETLKRTWRNLPEEKRVEQQKLSEYVRRDDTAILARDVVRYLLKNL